MSSFLDRFRGQGYKTRLLNPHDEFWDRKLGINTFGFHPGRGKSGDFDWQVHYAPTQYSEIFRVLKMVNLTSDDVFLDLGSGLGRTTFAASWLGAGKAVGVEIVQDLSDRANANLHRSHLSKNAIEFVCSNAAEYHNPAVTILYMCHPFGEETLRQVVRNFESDRAASARSLRIIYRNPMFEGVLRQTSWLECTGRVAPAGVWPSTVARYETSLWRSTK